MTVKVRNKTVWRGPGVYIGRPGPFGNPYRIGRDGDRDAVIEKYRRWFARKIARDVEFRRAVEGLRGKNLICWCAPQPCHGDVIRKYLRSGKV